MLNFIRNLPDMKGREISRLFFVLKRPDPSFLLMPKTRILYFCIYQCNSLKQPSDDKTTFSFRSDDSSASCFSVVSRFRVLYSEPQIPVAGASSWASVYSSSQLGSILMHSENFFLILLIQCRGSLTV